MRTALALLVTALLTGSAPAAVSPPRLLGLSVSNGGRPFSGDTRQLATVSPNGDGLRDRAIARFRLDQAATVRMQVVATGQALGPGRVVWRTKRRLAAGAHRLAWAPQRSARRQGRAIRLLAQRPLLPPCPRRRRPGRLRPADPPPAPPRRAPGRRRPRDQHLAGGQPRRCERRRLGRFVGGERVDPPGRPSPGLSGRRPPVPLPRLGPAVRLVAEP